MADCKTMMVRRNSRDSIGACGSRSSASVGHPPQPPQHNYYQYHHPQHRNTSRSRSYHHHLPHQISYHNQCHYYNTACGPATGYSCAYPSAYGYPPLSPSSSSSSSSPQPQFVQEQQFLGGPQQANSEPFLGHGHTQQNVPTNPRISQEPPPRPWIKLGYTKHKRTCFKVLCYNILCSRYTNSQIYSYCPNWALDWNYRRKAILHELQQYSADIISLQEMETEQYHNFFLPQLQLLGYSGIFAAKSRARTMSETKKKWVDGCAIFYKTDKFRLLSQHLIEFSRVAISNATRCAQCSDEMLNRVQTKDNIALAALFETKVDSEQAEGLRGLVIPRPRPLLVCTCHIHWDPNYCDVKLVQTMMLMQELKKITDEIDLGDAPEVPPTVPEGSRKISKGHGHNTRSGSSSSSGSSTSYSYSSASQNSPLDKASSALDKVNLLVCGDFNSLPESGVVEYIQNGSVSSSHPDFKGLNYKGYIETTTKKTGKSEETELKKKASSRSRKKGKRPLKPKPSDSDDFRHDFELKSAYTECTMPFTNYTLDFQGVIDYVFHSVKGLRPLGLLGPLDPTWLVQNNVVGAPHPQIPSDHLPLLVEMEMIPAI